MTCEKTEGGCPLLRKLGGEGVGGGGGGHGIGHLDLDTNAATLALH